MRSPSESQTVPGGVVAKGQQHFPEINIIIKIATQNFFSIEFRIYFERTVSEGKPV